MERLAARQRSLRQGQLPLLKRILPLAALLLSLSAPSGAAEYPPEILELGKVDSSIQSLSGSAFSSGRLNIWAPAIPAVCAVCATWLGSIWVQGFRRKPPVPTSGT